MKQEQIEQLRHFSRKLVRELGMLQQQHAESNATVSQCHALIEIDKEPGIKISKLGNLLLMSPSKISRLTKSLLKESFIKIEDSQSDKREKHLYLTDFGKTTIQKINEFAEKKIKGAFEFLNDQEILKIMDSISKYSNALEKSRVSKETIKISTLSSSRVIRKQIIHMIEDIEINEFGIPIPKNFNLSVLKAENFFHYNNSCNFWYAVDECGKIIGSIGMMKLDEENAEVKKFFVVKEYRGKGVSQKLMQALMDAARKHKFKSLFLGSAGVLTAAHKFYIKQGFKSISTEDLPGSFDICPLDGYFFQYDFKY